MSARRVRGEGSIYQRKRDGRYVGVIDLGHIGGKRVRKTVTAATMRELKPKFRRLKDELEAGIVTSDSTLEKWMTYWLDDVVGIENRPATMRTYRGYATNWIIPNLGHLRLDRIQPEHVRSLYAHMIREGKSPRTVRHVHALLHNALAQAMKDRKISYNPVDSVAVPKVEKSTHGKLTLAEAKQVLLSLDGRPDAARWVVALLAGLRQGEALGLRWEDIDFEEGRIRVERAAQRVTGQGVVIVPVKSASSRRTVWMLKPVAYALASMPGERTGYVFGGVKPLDSKTDWEHWRSMLDDAGVEKRPLHAARATCASLLMDARVPTKIIAEILGHSRPEVTEDHYLHGDTATHKDAMLALEDLLALPAA